MKCFRNIDELISNVREEKSKGCRFATRFILVQGSRTWDCLLYTSLARPNLCGRMNKQMTEKPKLGVYICHCGINIAATVDVEEVTEYAQSLPNVVVARNYSYMCSDPGQLLIKNDIKEHGLNRVVVASCSPRTVSYTHLDVYKRQAQGRNTYTNNCAQPLRLVNFAHILSPLPHRR